LLSLAESVNVHHDLWPSLTLEGSFPGHDSDICLLSHNAAR
jgi:hypothetical protein